MSEFMLIAGAAFVGTVAKEALGIGIARWMGLWRAKRAKRELRAMAFLFGDIFDPKCNCPNCTAQRAEKEKRAN